MSKETRLIKNTTILAIGNLLTKGINILLLPVYTAILTTEEYGLVDVVTVYASFFCTIISFQMERGLFRYLVEARTNTEKTKKYITNALIIVLLFCAIFCLLSVFAIKWVNSKLLALVVIYAISSAVFYLISNIPRGMGDNLTHTWGNCVSGFTQIITTVLLVVVLSWGVWGILSANIIAINLASLFLFVRCRLWRYISIKCIDGKYMKQLLDFSVPLVPSTLSQQLANTLSRVLIKSNLGVSANGIYSVANKFPSTYNLATNIFYGAWMESTAENVDDVRRNLYYQNIMHKAITLYSSANLGIIVIMPFVFPLLINMNFSEAQYYIPIMMTAAFLQGTANLFGSVYTALKRTKEIAITTIGATLLSVVIHVLLLPTIGLYAAALSLLSAYGLIALVQYFGARKMVGFHLSLSFLLKEGIMYALVFGAYYSDIVWIKILAVLCVIPYCLISNWPMIKGIGGAVINRWGKI